MLDQAQMAAFICCCQQCDEYQVVRSPQSKSFVSGYCRMSGHTLTTEPTTVSVPGDCPRGLGYQVMPDDGPHT